MAEMIRSPLAEADLDAILDDLNRRDPAAAERYGLKFAEKAESLMRFPESGRPRPEIAPNVRSTLVKPYVIFYRYEADTVQVLRIVHGRRDLRNILDSDSSE